MFEQAFKSIDDVLRKEAGCSSELDYTEQTSWLLFLKYLDGLEEDKATEAALNGKKHAYILDKQYRWETPTWGKTNLLLRYEPTWGDVDVLSKLVARLGPANQSQLLAAFSAGYQSARVIQLIRNASAHNNAQTMAEVHSVRSRYIVFPVTHPIQALYWIEPSSRDFLVLHAIEELRDASLAAIS